MEIDVENIKIVTVEVGLAESTMNMLQDWLFHKSLNERWSDQC